MKKFHRGILTVEFALVFPLIIFIMMFFYNIIFSITTVNRIQAFVYKVSEDIKTDMYIISKTEEILEIGTEVEKIAGILSEKFGIKIDIQKIGSFLYEKALGNYIKFKVYREFSKEMSYDEINRMLRLKRDIGIKVELGDEIIKENINIVFRLNNIFPVFDTYEVNLNHSISSKVVNEFINTDNVGVDLPSEKSVYYTKHGLKTSKVYHTNKNCFGLKFAKEINLINSSNKFKKGDIVNISGERLHLCSFCKNNKKSK